jgi:hypothetical protein
LHPTHLPHLLRRLCRRHRRQLRLGVQFHCVVVSRGWPGARVGVCELGGERHTNRQAYKPSHSHPHPQLHRIGPTAFMHEGAPAALSASKAFRSAASTRFSTAMARSNTM